VRSDGHPAHDAHRQPIDRDGQSRQHLVGLERRSRTDDLDLQPRTYERPEAHHLDAPSGCTEDASYDARYDDPRQIIV
jgi:hypothetical protein